MYIATFRRLFSRRELWAAVIAAVVLGAAVYATGRLRLQSLEVRPEPLIPTWSHNGDYEVVSLAGRFLVAELARYDDEFFAYLMFAYLVLLC